MDDKQLLSWAEFVATKFQSSRDGWVYSRELKGLKHIRFESDYTGYNHWRKRLKRALDWKHLTGRDSFSKAFRDKKRKTSLRTRFLQARAWISVSLRKDNNLPDGQINGIITNWEEDGEYIAIFQPRVGAKVIEFLRAEPHNPHAKAILAEMHAVTELSWPKENEAEETEESETEPEDD